MTALESSSQKDAFPVRPTKLSGQQRILMLGILVLKYLQKRPLLKSKTDNFFADNFISQEAELAVRGTPTPYPVLTETSR